MILSVLICSVPERQNMLANLFHYFKEISSAFRQEVEIIYDNSPKHEMSVGKKRQLLLERAKGEWIVFFDDDDQPNEQYINWIMEAIKQHPDIDCIGIRGLMTTNGENAKTWCHRLGYPIDGDGLHPTKFGYDYVRPIIHFNPVLRKKALQAGFRDMRFGEDMDYADRLNEILEKEYFIDQELFHYKYTNHLPHKEKYGIK